MGTSALQKYGHDFELKLWVPWWHLLMQNHHILSNFIGEMEDWHSEGQSDLPEKK